MEEVESYDITLFIKQLKLSVKFPCRLTLQQAGKVISPEIQSNGTNIFSVNRQVNVKEEKVKDYLEININLATDKGGNIMAGIIKINLKDIASSEGQNLTISLQKCLDPYATCLLTVKSVKLNRSRIRRGAVVDDKRQKYSNDNSKFQTKSEAMVIDPSKNFKQKARFNEAESFIQKRANVNSFQTSALSGGLKQKALSVVGFKGVNTSFQKELSTRFKHLNKRDDEQSKTMIVTGNRRQTDQTIKASLQANEKSLKLEIIKYKTKFQQCQRNLQQKTKQIKNLKDQISQLNRQLTQKQYLIEENNNKSNQIAKLQQNNKALSRQINQQRNKIIELERYIEQEKNSNFLQMSRFKEESQKKEYDFQKSLYQKKEQIKQIMEQNQYKINQINKMKALIEDLQKSLDTKTYEFEKNYNQQKNEHNKIKNSYLQQNAQLSAEVKKLQTKNQEIILNLKKSEEQITKLNKKIQYLEVELVQSDVKYNQQLHIRSELEEEKKNQKKVEEQLNSKIKILQKEIIQKQRQIQDLNNQLNEISNINKKKITQLLQKNKAYTAKIQELENKSNILTAQEEKLKRSLDMTQKQLKSIQQSQKSLTKTIKIKEDRILQLQKDISDLQGKNSLKDNLAKKETQYKAIQLQKLTQRATQLQKNYQKERQVAQERRLQLLKTENKLKILEQTNNRLNQQIKDLRIQQIKKEDDWSQKIKELKQDIKEMESRQAENNKALHSNEIQKLNLRNQLSKLEKIIEAQSQKNDKLKKRQSQLQNFIKTLHSDIENKNQNILELESSFKQLENEYKTLQADKSKTEKITSIINEQKDIAKSDINKLKKQLQKRQQKQEQYINQIKTFKQEITRWQLKYSSLTKEFQKFKVNISQSIKNSLSVKNSFSSIEISSNSLDYSRALSKSKYKAIYDFTSIENGDFKFGEVIENIVKESQQIIFQLNDELKKSKRQKDLLQKQLNTLNMRSKQTQEELERQLKEVNAQIEQLSVKHSAEIQEYEDKIFSYQRQAQKKQKALEDLNQQYNELKEIYQNYQASSSINQSQLVTKINSLKNKIIDWQRKDQNISQTFINLQQKITILEAQNTQLTHQIEVISQHLNKKQKLYNQTLDVVQQLTHQLQNTKKNKSDLSAQLLTLKQSLIIEKQNNKQLIAELKGEQEKCNNLKKFNNDILKEKEAYIKRQAEKQQKIYSLQEKIQNYMIKISEITEQIVQKEKLILQSRENVKVTQNQTNNLNTVITDLKFSLQRQRQKVKEKQRRIVQKQNEIEILNTQLKKSLAKYESQVSQLTQENELLSTQLANLREQHTQKQTDLQYQIKKLTENEKKLNQANIALQQQIFFEKQMNSLNQSQLQEHRMQNLELSTEIDSLKNELNNLNDEIRQKQESLFALSGKLYASDNRLQNKEEQFKSRIQKVELQWRYKIEQICQEYENKIEILEKQKSYVNTGMQGYTEAIQKLQNEKRALINEIQRQKEAFELKLKKIQDEKLACLVEKNKQIQKLREVFQQLQEKLKRRDFEYKSLEEDKKKVEEKLRDLRAEIEKSEDKKIQTIRNLQKDIDQLKRKEGQLKRFKDALKNNQWATERQIKKSIQLCGKGVLTMTNQENKEEVMNLIRNLQTSITKIALPNIDEL